MTRRARHSCFASDADGIARRATLKERCRDKSPAPCPDATAAVTEGSTFGSIEAVKTVADLYSPVAGTLTEVNDVNGSPEIVNQDPYGAGWLVKMTISNPSELDGLLDAEAYKALIGH